MIALASNVNIDPLARVLGRGEAYCCPYNGFMSELLDARSRLADSDIDRILLFLDAEVLLGQDFYALPTQQMQQRVSDDLDAILQAVDAYLARRPDVAMIIGNLALPPHTFITHIESHSDTGFHPLEERLNAMITGFVRERTNCLCLDWRKLVREHGYAQLHDERFWYAGRIRLTGGAFDAIARELGSLLTAHSGAARKVLVVDGDNTLWGGVLGEDGPDGIALSEEGLGKAYRDFQHAIKAVKETGVLLALCSKNNDSEVRELFAGHPMMVLSHDDFAATKVGWSPKVASLAQMAEELSLGLDAFVVVDDSPVERAMIRERLTEVAVPDFPGDPALLKSWLLAKVVPEYFPRLFLTDEDLHRSERYRANAARRELAQGLDLDGFIRGLAIRVRVRVDDMSSCRRIAQLTQKTNQFNLTTRRYSEAEVAGFIAAPDCAVFTLDYEDRFGMEGTVGVAISRSGSEIATIDTFLLSCRVIGRNVEFALLAEVVSHAMREWGLSRVRGAFIRTKRNEPAAGFFAEAGMAPLSEGIYEAESERLLAGLLKRSTALEVSENG